MKKSVLSLISILLIATFALAACGTPTPTAAPTSAPAQPTTAPAGPTATTAPVSKYNEAPDLAAQVAAGTLPPVEKRLPDQPVVTTADYAVVGKYGGTLQTASWWPEVGNVQLYFGVEAPINGKRT